MIRQCMWPACPHLIREFRLTCPEHQENPMPHKTLPSWYPQLEVTPDGFLPTVVLVDKALPSREQAEALAQYAIRNMDALLQPQAHRIAAATKTAIRARRAT